MAVLRICCRWSCPFWFLRIAVCYHDFRPMLPMPSAVVNVGLVPAGWGLVKTVGPCRINVDLHEIFQGFMSILRGVGGGADR